MPFFIRSHWRYLPVLLVTTACGNSVSSTGNPDAAARDVAAHDTAVADSTREAATDSGSTDSAHESGGGLDGTPSYTASCTPLSEQTGTEINTYHGRLDGTLAYVVPIDGPHECNGDGSHVHLQIRSLGNIYDVAVDTGQFTGDVNLYEADMPLPDGDWSEGWHGSDNLTYTALGIHASQFSPENPTTLGQKIASELAHVNHVSVFGIGYMQENGCHDVHYHGGGGQDGALVIEPLSPKAHILFFRFSTDSF